MNDADGAGVAGATDGTAMAPRVEIELDRRINFAMQQNDVPVVKALRVVNPLDRPLRSVRVRLSPEPAFAEPWETEIASIAPESSYSLAAVDLRVSPRFMGELTERIRGQVRVEVMEEGVTAATDVEPVELLARDEWGGLSSLAEILAAFVLPNHPTLDRVLREAAEKLGAWTGDRSLSGYQSKDRQRVYRQVAAIYGALELQDLSYINPPASFEAEGQRVRLPDRVLESRMGTCLDLSLLAAACLEQSGIRPLVVLVKGHACLAAWLEEECFDVAAIEDGLRLRKRIDLGEIIAFDPTCLTGRPAPGFEGAVREAQRHLANLDQFLCAIDVARARKGGIRPLPERIEAGASATTIPAASVVGSPVVPTLHVPGLGADLGAKAPETPATRLDRWCRRLLDRSLRNRLLNFRDTKKTIPLLIADLAKLEDALADGAAFQVHAKPDDLGAADPRDAEAFRRRTGTEAVRSVVAEELEARRLRSGLAKDELERRLLDIYRTARVELEEGGASALYLALSFLSWYETPQSTQARLAPILLLPVELQRRSIREGYSLRLTDDDPRLNVTLIEHLRHDFGLEIPLSDEALPQDGSGIDVPLVLHTFRQAVRDIDRWDVLEAAQIGFFSFTKFLMWRDLNQRLGDLLRSPVVAHLVNQPDLLFHTDSNFPRSEQLDDGYLPSCVATRPVSVPLGSGCWSPSSADGWWSTREQST